jgi:hypothetical protein
MLVGRPKELANDAGQLVLATTVRTLGRFVTDDLTWTTARPAEQCRGQTGTEAKLAG